MYPRLLMRLVFERSYSAVVSFCERASAAAHRGDHWNRNTGFWRYLPNLAGPYNTMAGWRLLDDMTISARIYSSKRWQFS